MSCLFLAPYGNILAFVRWRRLKWWPRRNMLRGCGPEVVATFPSRQSGDAGYHSLLDNRQFVNRAAVARYLGVSRARVTQALRRLS